MKIAVFGNTSKEGVLETASRLFEELESREVQIVLHSELYNFLRKESFPLSEKITQINSSDDYIDADVAISLGGDGTFINTVMRLGKIQIPMFGINLGHLGFLADVSVDELPRVIEDLFNGDYHIAERTVLETQLSEGKLKIHPYALNEVSIMKQDSSSMLDINSKVNGAFLANYKADGIIISTPTGSTAYSMSVGGPIMVPEGNSLMIAPVAPHSLTIRPLVVRDSWDIELDVNSRSHCYLIAIDGHSEILDNRVKLTIRKADFVVKTIKFKGHSFFDTLREKLMWGVDGR